MLACADYTIAAGRRQCGFSLASTPAAARVRFSATTSTMSRTTRTVSTSSTASMLAEFSGYSLHLTLGVREHGAVVR